MIEKVELKKGDKVIWKHAPFTSALVDEEHGYNQFTIKFDATGPLKGQTMRVGRDDLHKINLLEELAIEGDDAPPDPFFRSKNHPDYLKEERKPEDTQG